MAYQNMVRRIKFLKQSSLQRGPKHIVELLKQWIIRRRYKKNKFVKNELIIHDSTKYFQTFNKNYFSRFPLSKSNKKEFFIGTLLSLQGYDEILIDAEQFVEGKFRLFGSCVDAENGNYDWHKDYVIDKIYTKNRFDKINYLGNDLSDIKRPWELSRMYWLWWIGKAYWISGNGVWTKEFVCLIDDWQTNNPIDIGINWVMPMEVSIRGFWLTMGFGLFYGAPNINDLWWSNYLKLVYKHGEYLINNLEYFPNLTNHYISNCFGLLSLGSFFYLEDQGKIWFNEGYKRILNEIENQVLEDGVHFELSICYHRLVLEMFLISSAICKQSGNPFPDWAMKKLEKMSEFLYDYSSVDLTIPQFGDNDDGIILKVTNNQNIYDHSDTLTLAAVIFNRSDFIEKCKEFSQSALLITGTEGYELFKSLKKISENKFKNLTQKILNDDELQNIKITEPRIKLYSEGGFAILENSYFKSIFDVGVIGLHGNNDTLSFVLNSKSNQIIIDPGTYCYTSDIATRNLLRSSKAHNSPVIDNFEIAEFDGLWRVKKEIPKPITRNLSNNNCIEIESTHLGYKKYNVVIKRKLTLLEKEFTVIDEFLGDREHNSNIRFTLNENCKIEKILTNKAIISCLLDRIEFTCSEPFEITDEWYSPSYGVRVSTKGINIMIINLIPKQINYNFKII